jgi:integrase/recombinase XerD
VGTISRLPGAAQTPTMAEVCADFLADARDRLRLSANTVRAYRSDLHTAAAVLTAPLDAIATTDIEQYLATRANESASTLSRRRASLARFFRWAQRAGYCTHNPVDLVEAQRVPVKQPRPIPSADRDALAAAMNRAPQPYRLMVILLAETGMRADEVLSLDVDDVCLDAGREGLRLRETKNHHERTVVLTADRMPRSLRGLRSHLRGQDRSLPGVPLFRSLRGTRVSYDALHYQWAKICERAGLLDQGQPRYTMHQLLSGMSSGSGDCQNIAPRCFWSASK